MKAVAVALVLLGAGCVEGGEPDCQADGCDAGETCVWTGACVAAAEARTVDVHWTIDGLTPSSAAPQGCTHFDSLRVSFGNDAGEGFSTVVPCTDASALFSNITLDLPTAYVTGYVGSDEHAHAQLAIPDGPIQTVTLDLHYTP